MIQQFLDDNGHLISIDRVQSKEHQFKEYYIRVWSKEKEFSFSALFKYRMLAIPAFISMIQSKLYEKQLKEYFGQETYTKVFAICNEEVLS